MKKNNYQGGKNLQPTIYWTYFEDGPWRFLLAATDGGLCYTGSQNRDVEELEAWAAKRFKGSELVENAEKLALYVEQFKQYFNGERKVLDFSIHYEGTDFQKGIWHALQDIPFGETTTYSAIAQIIGNPKAVRAVGTAIGANPVMVVIPCHRVIGKNGTLTGFRGGPEMKEKLLELEFVNKK